MYADEQQIQKFLNVGNKEKNHILLKVRNLGNHSHDQSVLEKALLSLYTVSQKKGATLSMAITLSILDRFPKFFHCCKEQ